MKLIMFQKTSTPKVGPESILVDYLSRPLKITEKTFGTDQPSNKEVTGTKQYLLKFLIFQL